MRGLWFAYLKQWLEEHCQKGERVHIAIDRTSWGTVNLLVVSLIWNKRGIPLYWELLDKLGSTSWEEQRDALSKVLPLLKDHRVVVLGDREFCSVKLGRWLNEQECYFCLRLKCNTNIREAQQAWRELAALGLTPGTSLYQVSRHLPVATIRRRGAH